MYIACVTWEDKNKSILNENFNMEKTFLNNFSHPSKPFLLVSEYPEKSPLSNSFFNVIEALTVSSSNTFLQNLTHSDSSLLPYAPIFISQDKESGL